MAIFRKQRTAVAAVLVAALSATFGVVGVSPEAQAVEGCIDNPYGDRALHLRGGFSGWSASDDYKFTYNCDQFELVFEATGGHEFKVADPNWSAGTDFGSGPAGGRLAAGEPLTLQVGGGNLFYEFTGTHYAVLDVSSSTTQPQLTISDCPVSPLGGDLVALRGDFNADGARTQDYFLYSCDAYYLNVDIDGLQELTIDVAGEDAMTTYGAPSAGVTLTPETELELVAGVASSPFTFDFTGEHTLEFRFREDGTPVVSIGERSWVNPGIALPVTDPVARSVTFDSREEAFKAPFGAVPAGTDVTFALQALDGVESATLVVETRRLEGNQDVIEYSAAERLPMTSESLGDGLERWVAEHSFDELNVYGYYFELVIDGQRYVYGNNERAVPWTAERGSFGLGVIEFADQAEGNIRRYRQTVHDPDYTVPEWAPDIVYYYVFPERFRNGDESNDPRVGEDKYLDGDIEFHEDWMDTPYTPEAGDGSDDQWNNDFFGGDLAGIIEKLDYLEELGVNTIYTTPIFESGSNHKYDHADYLSVDNGFGTNEEFTELTEAAAARGIRVIVDASFNHTGSDAVYFDRYERFDGIGAFEGGVVRPDSPFADWYQFNADGTYRNWGYDTMPELAESDAWKDFAFRNDDSVTDTWLDRGASGWRMDVAPWVSDEFWREWRTEVKANDPEALTVAETWFDSSKYFLGDTFDSTMNYIFRTAVIDFANGKDATEAYEGIELMREAYPEQSFYALMNLLSTHDEPRALNEFGYTGADSSAAEVEAAKQRLRLAVLFQMTFPGSPTVFYGDEVGLTGGSDPYNRRTYPWADQGGDPDEALLEQFKELIELRNEHDVLRRGSVDEPLYTDEHSIVLDRVLDDVYAVTAFNSSQASTEITVEVAPEGRDQIFVDALTGEEVTAEGSQLTITVAGVDGRVLLPKDVVDQPTVPVDPDPEPGTPTRPTDPGAPTTPSTPIRPGLPSNGR